MNEWIMLNIVLLKINSTFYMRNVCIKVDLIVNARDYFLSSPRGTTLD
jgi:hypothetical protein